MGHTLELVVLIIKRNNKAFIMLEHASALEQLCN